MTFVKHEACPKCNSSDGLAVYTDGSSYCFVCETYGKKGSTEVTPTDETLDEIFASEADTKVHHSSLSVPSDLKTSNIPDRGVSLTTCKKFNVKVRIQDGEIIQHYYPYTDRDGSVVAYKARTCEDKSFRVIGSLKESALFGQHLFPPGGKYITVVEGELDALSAYELMGSKWPVVSIRNGAQAALRDCKKSFDYLDSFQNVIICFDNDDPGKEAARKVAELFSPKKARICKLDKKDANEYLVANAHQEFVDRWWKSEAFSPPGIICGTSLVSLLEDETEEKCYDYPWEGLNDITYGLRLGELVTVTAGSGMGKTQFLRELIYHFLKTTDFNIGLAMLEETKKSTMLGLMSIAASKPLHLPKKDVHRTKEECRKAFDETWNTGKLYLLDDSAFGSHHIDEILAKIRYLAKGFDCKIIVLDHISIIVSDQRNGDERKALDEIATKLKTLTVELGISLFMVCHSKRQTNKSLEEGGQTSLSDLRGTAGIGQLSNMVFGLERDGQHEDPVVRNTTSVRVVKNRFSGLTGVGCQLHYDRNTGRISEVLMDEETANEGEAT